MRPLKIKILTVSFALILLGTGVVDANDLYAYRYVREDGKVLNTTDTEYTELERITSQGKELATVAFMGENQDKDTMRFKLKVKLSGNFHPDQIYKIIAVSKDKDGTITEIEQLVPRALYGRITTPKFSITQDGDPHKIYGKRGRLILVNNAVHIRPANMDTNLDLIKAGIISHERRVPVTNEKRGTSWCVNPMIQNRDIMYRGESIILKFPLGEDGKFRRMRVMNSFKKISNIHVWAVGRNQVNRDKSINSIYFLYGRERTRYFTFGIFNENIEPIYNDSGFHTADGKKDMFGLGISKTKSFANGWYGDALCQYAFFNRDIYTVNEGVYGRQHASMRGQDIGLSLEVGRKIQIHPNWSVQPEVQYTYHMYHQNAYRDSLEREFGDKNIRDREIRAGIKVQYKWIYAKVNRYFRNSTGAKAHIDTEKEIGIERRINKDYTLRAFWSSYSYPYIRVKSNKETVVYKNQQNQFSLMLQKYF